MKIRPQVLVAMLIIGALGTVMAYIGWKMEAPEIVTGAAGAAITGIIALAMKVLDSE